MKITRQLRLDRMAADGTAPVQLTITWEGNRLRLGVGVVVKPDHWDAEQHQVRAVRGTPHASVNPRLNRAHEAAEAAQETARKEGRQLPPTELKAAVEAAMTLVPVAEQPAPTLPLTDFAGLYRQWLADQASTPRGVTGRPMAQTTRAGLLATLERFLAYAQARGRALDVTGLDLAFYQDFRAYLLDELGQRPSTFGKHVARLRAFLAWLEDERSVPVHRHYRKFYVPQQAGHVSALTEAELRRVAGLDFASAAVREQLRALRQELSRSASLDPDDFTAWVDHVELARDKFLQCCYTGLRISDADRARWADVRGNLLVIESTVKTEVTVFVPFYDDELFKPVALAERYEHRSLLDLLVPVCYRCNEFLKVVQRLSGLTRLNLTTKIGRKTFVTLKLYQGVPARLIMQATGHRTEAAFNHYVGVDELRLVEEFMRKSPRKRAA